ncbi:MAG: DNA polymerase III subunit chi [Alphaproteobacteria bacterium]|nr:DNA polymerase III subunit chi [Alphaproteobacteria bacterium]
MTKIQFYHLLSTSIERAIPKLMEKALEGKSRVVMLASDEQMIKRVSDAMWSGDPNGFLPHGTAKEAHKSEQPIYLSLVDENPNNADVLVVLDGSMPTSYSTYAKVLDVFDGNDDAQVNAARERWTKYKEQGVALQYVKQQPNGGWKIESESNAA